MPPQFTEVPDQVIKVMEGKVASVVCRAFGSPPPVIQWSKAFASLPKGRATIENGTLTITSFSLNDVGTYQCKATNKLGSVSVSTGLNMVEGEENWFNRCVWWRCDGLVVSALVSETSGPASSP